MTEARLTWDLDGVCVCGHTGRRHHAHGNAYAYCCAECACMYFETAPIGEDRPVYAQLADAIRCTSHIENRELRAMYVLKDMELRGYAVLRRDERGRFAKPVPA